MLDRKIAVVMGRAIPKPRPDWGVVWVAMVYGVGPVLAIGAVMDLIAQHAFGVCTGLWCGAR
jgi:hypothetical protein